MKIDVGTLLDDRLEFLLDMNQDGILTISDVWFWCNWLFYLPGDLVELALFGTPVGDFFEITPWSLGGIASGVLSFFFWFYIGERWLCGRKPRR